MGFNVSLMNHCFESITFINKQSVKSYQVFTCLIMTAASTLSLDHMHIVSKII